jgi:hypothetical protein
MRGNASFFQNAVIDRVFKFRSLTGMPPRSIADERRHRRPGRGIGRADPAIDRHRLGSARLGSGTRARLLGSASPIFPARWFFWERGFSVC